MPIEAPASPAAVVLLDGTDRDRLREMTVAEAVLRYRQLMVQEGAHQRKSDTFSHCEMHLEKRFAGTFGQMKLCDIRNDHIREWLDALASPKTRGQPMHLRTRHHHLKSVKAFFRRAVLEEWLDRNPARTVKLPPVLQEDVNVIPVRDAFQFFKENRNDRAIGRLALEAFGGLRFNSAGNIVVDEIHFDQRALVLPAIKHKSKKRHYRQGHPANLWEWLKFAPPECWQMTRRHYMRQKTFMWIISKLRPAVAINEADRERFRQQRNVFRHSFASYLLAIVKTYPPVQYLMQHATAKMTEHYEGRATERDARLYFAITPQTVLLSWEEFVSQYDPGEAGIAAPPIVPLAQGPRVRE